MWSRIQSIFRELRRRSVFKVATVYAAVAWGAALGAADLLPAFGAPDWTVRVFVVCAVLGLPIAIALAWAYEITPQGIVRDAEDDRSTPVAPPRVPASSATVLYGSTSTVRVTWRDGGGSHEKVFQHAFTIGRDAACEIHLDDPMISRRHAEVTYSDGRWWIADLGSRNGTMLDDRTVSREPLPPHCRVRLYEKSPVLRLDVRAGSSEPTLTSTPVR